MGELYSYTRASMPVGAGGSLPAGQYLALIAYLLEQNGYPAGEAALDPDEAMLRAIGIE